MSVEQLQSPAGQTSTLIIRPARETLLSYEGQTSRGALRIENVQLSSVRLDSGDGQDDFRLQNTRVDQDVRVENPDGGDFFGLLNSVVGGRVKYIDKSSTLLASQVTVRDTKISGRLEIESTESPLLVTANGMRSGGGYMKLGDIKGEARDSSHITIQNSDISGRLTVESAQKVNVAVSDTNAGAIAIEATLPRGGIDKATPYLMNFRSTRVRVDGDLRIASASSLRVNSVATEVGNRYLISSNGISGDASDVRLTSVGAGRLDIRGGVESMFVRIADLNVSGASRISTGDGDDELRILDSVFGGSFAADGGLGDDLLVIRRSKFSGRRILTNWERILE